MIDSLSFEIKGEPLAKGRPRARMIPGKAGKPGFVSIYTPTETRKYEEYVRSVCLRALAAKPGWAEEDRRYSITVHVYRTHDGKGGDLDNYCKCVMDSVNGLAFPDDRYVRSIVATLNQDKSRPRTIVVVDKLP